MRATRQPRHYRLRFFMLSSQEIILKRAADLAEALYSMPRNPNQLSLPAPRSPAMNNTSGFNSYTGQLAVSVQDTTNGQWEEGWSHRYPAFTF
jgi:early B-cell factor